jgi:hypothetical protein
MGVPQNGPVGVCDEDAGLVWLSGLDADHAAVFDLNR